MCALDGRADSFYACYFFKKGQKYETKDEWMCIKQQYKLFFYHIRDQYSTVVKLIRKGRKLNLDGIHTVLDRESLEMLYVPENTKFVVTANEYDLESPWSLSDI
jgi:hypothetical protein